MPLILAVDPGGTTGYSYIHQDAIEDGPTAGQMSPQEFMDWTYHVAENWRKQLTIVCERFTISGRTLKVSKAGSYDALEVIGFLRWASKHYCGRDLEMSSPSDVMSLFPDKKLKALGWYQPGLGHANDSLRHLARACAKRHLIRVGTPPPS